MGIVVADGGVKIALVVAAAVVAEPAGALQQELPLAGETVAVSAVDGAAATSVMLVDVAVAVAGAAAADDGAIADVDDGVDAAIAGGAIDVVGVEYDAAVQSASFAAAVAAAVGDEDSDAVGFVAYGFACVADVADAVVADIG